MGPEQRSRWFVDYEVAELRRRKTGSVLITSALLPVHEQLEATSGVDPDEDEAQLDAITQSRAYAERQS